MSFCDNKKSLELAYQLGDVTAFHGHECWTRIRDVTFSEKFGGLPSPPGSQQMDCTGRYRSIVLLQTPACTREKLHGAMEKVIISRTNLGPDLNRAGELCENEVSAW
jgi:hypothetical protein